MILRLYTSTRFISMGYVENEEQGIRQFGKHGDNHGGGDKKA